MYDNKAKEQQYYESLYSQKRFTTKFIEKAKV